MSAPAVPRYLSVTDSSVESLVEAFNQFQRETIQAMSKRLTRGDNLASSSRERIHFRTPDATDPVVVMNSGLATPAQHVVCSWLERDDGFPVSGPWSCVAANISSTQISVTFTGLAPNIQFTASFLIE